MYDCIEIQTYARNNTKQHLNQHLTNNQQTVTNIRYYQMTNRDLQKIVEKIQADEQITLSDIAAALSADRSHLSSFINSKQTKSLGKVMLRRFKNTYPSYFDAPNKNNTGTITMSSTDRIAELERWNNHLQKIIESSLADLRQGQQEIKAMLKTNQQNIDDVLMDRGREPEKVKEQTGKRNAANLRAMTRIGKDEGIPGKM